MLEAIQNSKKILILGGAAMAAVIGLGYGIHSFYTKSMRFHVIQLGGPVSGAVVKVFMPDCKTELYQSATDSRGMYLVDAQKIQSMLGAQIPEIFCIEARGGQEQDQYSTEDVALRKKVPILGVVHGFVRSDDFLHTNGTIVNLLGVALADLVLRSDDITLARLDQHAPIFGYYLNKDGKTATLHDITSYSMGTRPDVETSARDYYLQAVEQNNETNRQLFIDLSSINMSPIRYEVLSQGNNTALFKLIPFSKGDTLRYDVKKPMSFGGSKILPNVYQGPFVVQAQDFVYSQECATPEECDTFQTIQVNNTATDIMRYEDTGGIDLTEYYATQERRADLIQKINATQKSIDESNAAIKAKDEQIHKLDLEISGLQSDADAIQAEIDRLEKLQAAGE